MRSGKRIYKKQVWLTKEEVILLNEKCNKTQMTQSDFIRSLLVNGKVVEKPDDRFYEVVKLMRAISNNLNQIAKKAHSLGYVDELAYKKEADKWHDFMQQVKSEFLIKK